MFQLFPEAALDVSVTEPPEQKVSGPPGVITGVGKLATTVTTIGVETAEVQPRAMVCTV